MAVAPYINIQYEGMNSSPAIVRINTNATLAQVTTQNWILNSLNNGSLRVSNGDQMEIAYAQGTTSAATSMFNVLINSTGILLSVAESSVVLPVVSGDFAVFSGTAGAIADLGYLPSNAAKTVVVMANAATVANHIMVSTDTAGTTGNRTGAAINDGNLQAGRDTVAGALVSFPATTTTGTLAVTAVANSGNFNVVISNASHGQSTTYSIADVAAATGQLLNKTAAFVSGNVISASGTAGITVDGGVVANRILYTTFATPDAASDLIAFDITVGQAALAAGGTVTIQASSGSKQYKIRSLQLNSGGTNFSGGGGDRLGQVTDGTTVYSVVPAATMQSLTNAQWGVTALPNPASAAINTSTVAAAALTFKYSGGTTDYTAGSLVISGVLQRVA